MSCTDCNTADKIPEHDSVWNRVESGPQIKLTSGTKDHDEFITDFAGRWMEALESQMAMIQMLDNLVRDFKLMRSNSEHIQDLPEDYHLVYRMGNDLLTSFDSLMKYKSVIKYLAKIREDWGTFTAFNNAPDDDKILWCNRK